MLQFLNRAKVIAPYILRRSQSTETTRAAIDFIKRPSSSFHFTKVNHDSGKVTVGGRRHFSNVPAQKDLIDVLDDCGVRTGEILSRKSIHELGKIHRAVHLYLFDLSDNLLLQRRSQKTDHYAGRFGISVTGHIDAGESSSDAIRREIQEELGLSPTDMNIQFLFSFRQDATISPTYIDRQFNDVYACFHDFQVENITFDSKDIIELKLVPFSEFKEMVFHGESYLASIYGRELPDVEYFLRSVFKSGKKNAN